jgi:dethiobiotin synthetase
MSQGHAVFVAGFGSGAGKSTTCLAILKTLMNGNFSPDEIAYIKPATQCESLTDVTAFCETAGIEAIPLGPVVFRQGFTNSVLSSPDPVSAGNELLRSIRDVVVELRNRKKFVVVDGVGYPSVGACCGLGNARVAAALAIPVLLVGPPGLGDCIDTFDLMMTYFAAKGATVSAAIVNRLADSERHKASDVTPLVERWFVSNHPAVMFLGALPVVPRVDGSGNVKSPEVFAMDVAEAADRETSIRALLQSLR